MKLASVRGAFFLGGFLLGRGLLFIAPVLLANMLPATAYGLLEYGQSIASLAGTVLALGTASITPLLLIGAGDPARWAAVLAHQCVVSTLLLAAAAALWLMEAPWLWCVVPLAVAALMQQTLWSVVLKSLAHREASVLLDAGFWLSMCLGVLAAWTWSVPAQDRLAWGLGGLAGYTALFFALTAWRFRHLPRGPAWPDYQALLRASMPLMMGAVLSIFVTCSGRLGVGFYASPTTFADYAALFRATAVPMVIHQIVLLSAYRSLYALPLQAVEARFIQITAMVVAAVLGFMLVEDGIMALLGDTFELAFVAYRVEGRLILSQCILWSAIALNDTVVARTPQAGGMVRCCGLFLLLAVPALMVSGDLAHAELRTLIVVHSGLMAGYYLAQMAALHRGGVRFWRAWGLALGSFVLVGTGIVWF